MEKEKLVEELKAKMQNSRTRERNAYANYTKLQAFEEGYQKALDEVEDLID